VIGFDASQPARSIGATEASPIREVRIREVSMFCYSFVSLVVMLLRLE
jgi:hypothetical protein